jgi:uncharacterized phage protein gp47/JayE
MPLPIPSSPSAVIDKIANNVQRELPEAKPKERRTMIRAVTTGIGFSMFDVYTSVSYAVDQSFPQTAESEYLKRWGDLNDVTQLTATGARGVVNATGVLGEIVPSGTNYTSDNATFTTVGDSSISATESDCGIYTLSGVATVTTVSPHQLADNVKVTIAGATPSDLNGTFDISVINTSQFEYETTVSDVVATGGITATFERAVLSLVTDVSVEDNVGVKTNVPFGSSLTIVSPISNIDDRVYPDANGLSGGTDQESTEDWRKRILFAEQNPVAMFNESSITLKCFEINGVTRVFVRPITPEVGQVTVYFTRDNDDNTIPTENQREIVKNNVLTILPVDKDPSDVIFPELIGVPVNFQFSSIVPDTTTMRQAISDNLTDFFRGNTEEGGSLDEDLYRAAIVQATSTNGESVRSFDLISPSGDIAIASGEIPIIGDVTF